MHTNARPVTIRGVRYNSHTEAAIALGLSPQAINRAAQVGKLDTVGLNRPKAAEPVLIGEHYFRSKAEAARFFGLRPDRLHHYTTEQLLARLNAPLHLSRETLEYYSRCKDPRRTMEQVLTVIARDNMLSAVLDEDGEAG